MAVTYMLVCSMLGGWGWWVSGKLRCVVRTLNGCQTVVITYIYVQAYNMEVKY